MSRMAAALYQHTNENIAGARNGYVITADKFAINYGEFEFGGMGTANLHSISNRMVYVYANAGDTANFFDSSGNDIFYGLPSYGYMRE